MMCSKRLVKGCLLLGLTLSGAFAQTAFPVVPYGQNFNAVLALPSTAPTASLAYASASPLQLGELWLPAGAGPHAVVVLLHGGCWQAAYGVGHIRPLATALAEAGYAVWALEYRRLGDEGGGWPGTLLDAGAGVDHLRSLATCYPLDLRRVVLVGHSAGGHLALWAASRAGLTGDLAAAGAAPLPVRGVVGLAAIADLAAYAAGTNSCEQSAVALLGGPGEFWAERLALADPTARRLAADCRVLLLQGDRDRIVTPPQAEAYRASRQPGEVAEIRLLEEAGHFDLIHPGTPALAALKAAVAELLASP